MSPNSSYDPTSMIQLGGQSKVHRVSDDEVADDDDDNDDDDDHDGYDGYGDIDDDDNCNNEAAVLHY